MSAPAAVKAPKDKLQLQRLAATVAQLHLVCDWLLLLVKTHYMNERGRVTRPPDRQTNIIITFSVNSHEFKKHTYSIRSLDS